MINQMKPKIDKATESIAKVIELRSRIRDSLRAIDEIQHNKSRLDCAEVTEQRDNVLQFSLAIDKETADNKSNKKGK